MKKRRQQWVVVYDISQDKERGKVEKTLKGWGHRAQKSVFLVQVSRRGQATLQRKIEALNIQTGTVLFFRLQTGTKPLVVGQAWENPDAESVYMV